MGHGLLRMADQAVTGRLADQYGTPVYVLDEETLRARCRGFIGEFLILLGIFQVNTWVAALTATGVVLGAVYMLYMYRRVIFGKIIKADLKAILDLNRREVLVFAPLILVVLWMGLYPAPFLDVMHASVDNLIEPFEQARAAASGVAVAGR